MLKRGGFEKIAPPLDYLSFPKNYFYSIPLLKNENDGLYPFV
jgi:hypothetical protein